MKKYIASLMVLLFLLSPASMYAASSFTLKLSAKEVQRGGEITFSGTVTNESDEVVIKIVSPNETVFFIDAISPENGYFTSKVTIPNDEDLAPNGEYKVIATNGLMTESERFTVGISSGENPETPVEPSTPTTPGNSSDSSNLDGSGIPLGAGKSTGSVVKPELSGKERYIVGSSTIAEAIRQAGDTVTFELPEEASEFGIALEFPTKSLYALNNKNKDLIVTVGKSTVRFPAGALTAPNDDSSRIRIVLKSVWSDESKTIVEQAISSKQGYKATNTVFSVVIQLIKGSSITEIHQLNKPAIVTLKLTEQQVKLISSKRAGVFYVNGESVEYVSSKTKNDEIVFQVDHFSYYAILEYSHVFVDMVGHWAEEAVNGLAAKKIVNGIDEQHYAPNRPITRAEFVTLLMRAIEQSSDLSTTGQKTDHSFDDVPSGLYYSQQVSDAVALDIITGYNGKFRPNDQITREEAVLALVRAADYFHLVTVNQGEPSFTDEKSIAVWAKPAVSRAWTKGLVEGDGSRFIPKKAVTRAEVAVMITRLISDNTQ